MNMTVNNSGVSQVQQSFLSGAIDVHTFLQIVMSEKVKLMDEQLAIQVQAMQDRNQQLAKLNDVLAKLTAFQGAISGTDPGSKPKDWNVEKQKRLEIPLNDAIREAGIEDLGFTGRGQVTPRPGEKADGSAGGHMTEGVANSGTTKGQVDAAIAKVKGLIDGESNNQQMDMIRLQSLNNKKNESIDTLTTTQKKHTDVSSGIIRNLS